MSPARPKILLVSNAERGQCNVYIATARAVLRADPTVDLHFASYAQLQDEIRGVSDDAQRREPGIKPISWHTITGPTHLECVLATGAKLYPGLDEEETQWGTPNFVLPLSMSVTMAATRDLANGLMGWDGPSFMKVHDSVKAICDEVMPDLIVIDPLMAPAITAAWYHESPMCALSPNAIKETAWGSIFPWSQWTYPALMSGIPFPIPWYLVPLNVFYNYYGRHVAAKVPPTASKYIADAIGKPRRAMRDLVNASGPDAPTIFVNTLPELDFPWLPCPRNIVANGPIVSPVKPLSEADAGLADWINRAPTIFVNLGTQTKVSEAKAIEMASALSICLDTLDDKHPERKPLQVLWKIKRTSKYDATSPDSRVYNILKDKIEFGRVRITNWLVPEPLAILQTGKIACFVHHGGANSYNEAILNGVPHVVLPAWTDCYEYAERVEFHGIGRIGARRQVPQVKADELSRELLAVLDGKQAHAMKLKAEEFATLCKTRGDASETVAAKMLELARNSTHQGATS